MYSFVSCAINFAKYLQDDSEYRVPTQYMCIKNNNPDNLFHCPSINNTLILLLSHQRCDIQF